MFRKIACLFALVLSACTAGPSRPERDDYPTPAVAVRIHFLDLPDGEIQYAQVRASWAHHVGNSVEERTDQQTPAGYAEEKFLTPDVELTLQGSATLDSLTTNLPPLPDLRFFALSAGLSSPPDPQTMTSLQPHPGMWRQPGLLLAYATQATAWSPFGPSGDTVTFPPGYAWLKRACGDVPGQIRMEVRPIDETVEFRQMTKGYAVVDIEAWEQAFAMECGVTGPALDLGTRVFFDHAQEIAWAPDDASLYYLSVADEEDITQSVALRQVRLADSAASELAVVPHGHSLQVDKTGAVFAHDNQALLTLAPTTPAMGARTLSFWNAVVSPDGRWIAHWIGGYAQDPIGIWDTVAGADLTFIDGAFAGWSPDAQLAYWPSWYQPTGLGTFSPGVPGGNPRNYPTVVDKTSSMSLVWSTTGPLLAKPADATDGACAGCGGLALLDLTTGVERQVLAPSAGKIGPSSTSALDVLVVWVTRCLGLFDTLCSSSLLRIDLLDASVQTVAVSSQPGPVALSWDARRVAFGTPDGIHVKPLP